MRHSDPPRRAARAVQLPTSASGNRLCRHGIAGGCTRWCSYKLFTKAVAITTVVLALIIGGVWLTGGEGQARVRDVLLGLGFYLVLVVPGIVFMNSRDRD
jgi:tellurite resistance protein TehA-like permease